MKFPNILLAFLFSLGLVFSSQAQIGQYNFFIGEDAELMQTTLKGLGSINSTGYMDAQLVRPLNAEKASGLFVGGGVGLYYKKFRFKNNLVLENIGDVLTPRMDDPSLYSDGFFSYSKSKLVVFTATLQPEIGFYAAKKKFAIGVAPRIDFAIGAKHKRKFKLNDEKTKFKDTGVNMYDVNPVQIGLNVRIGTLKNGLEAAYMFSPFFASASSPQVQTVSLGFYTRIVVGGDDDDD